MSVPDQGAEEIRRERRGTVLVVDDYAPLRRLVAEILSAAGYTIVEAAGLVQALEAASTHGPIDLAIVDVALPDADFLDFESEFARLQPGARRVAISGHLTSDLEQAGLLDADVPFLAKPFSAQQLLDAVDSALSAPS